MSKAAVWDAFHQMPPGREFEAYHHISDTAQTIVYHSHPYYEIYFSLSGHNRVMVEGEEEELKRLIYSSSTAANPFSKSPRISSMCSVPIESRMVFGRIH